MSAAFTFGRILETTLTGTSSFSYTVPANRFAVVEAGVSSGFAEISVATQKFTTGGDKLHVLAFATAGQQIDIAFNSATSPNYKILVMYALTLP